MPQPLIRNPFTVGPYSSDEYFCDRNAETQFLIKQITNGRNVALISPRRMGKTGLIHHLFATQTLADYHKVFVDIYSAANLQEFVYLLSKAVSSQLRGGARAWLERFVAVVRSLQAVVRWDAQTDTASLEFKLGQITEPEQTLDEIFSYLDGAEKPTVVAIDEFQTIRHFREANTEALLRTKIQQCANTQFIFSGSKRHVMANMFGSAAKPFYQSAITMGLNPIDRAVYTDFAEEMFRRCGRRVERALVETVYDRFEGCTWFVQMTMNELFALTPPGGLCYAGLLPEALDGIVAVQAVSYMETLARLSARQRAVLLAIAREGRAQAVTSADFVRRYGLVSASSVQAALKGLLESDIITADNGEYRIYDHFFALWLKTY